jgi:hypothetical protein
MEEGCEGCTVWPGVARSPIGMGYGFRGVLGLAGRMVFTRGLRILRQVKAEEKGDQLDEGTI